jgi:hypothetical protein
MSAGADCIIQWVPVSSATLVPLFWRVRHPLDERIEHTLLVYYRTANLLNDEAAYFYK